MNQAQKAIEAIKLSYEAKWIMAKYTNTAMSKRHGVSFDVIAKMRAGYEPKNMSEEKRRKIRMDFMRYDDAKKDYLPMDTIAERYGISRNGARNIAYRLGLSKPKKKPARKPKKDVGMVWPGTAMGRFAVMRLSQNPSGQAYYY